MFMYVNDYNYPKNPTFNNTNRYFYNCGGYALGVYKWYLPASSKRTYARIEKDIAKGNYEEGTMRAVKHMCKEFNFFIVSEEEVRSHRINSRNMEIIAFRYECDGFCNDFHFMKLGKNNSWYEKRGSDPIIYRHDYNYVFGVWNNRYDGPIVFIARPRKGI